MRPTHIAAAPVPSGSKSLTQSSNLSKWWWLGMAHRGCQSGSRPLTQLPGLALSVLGLICFCIGVQASGLTVTDDRGVTVTFTQSPKRIITLLPSLTEAVCALEACNRLVATDRYSDWPESVKALPKVGGIDDTPIERVLSLHPDVVLAARSSRAIGRLEELHIKVIALEPQSLNDVYHTMRVLSQLLDTANALSLWQTRVDEDIRRAASAVPTAYLHRSVYVEVSSEPYAASRGSYIGELLERLQLYSVIPATYGAFPKLNPEWLLAHPPDLILSDEALLKSMATRPEMQHVSAFTQNRVCRLTTVEFEQLGRPGPRVGESALLISRCLNTLLHSNPQTMGQ